jgi:SOS-response transcriptional repressor LexA
MKKPKGILDAPGFYSNGNVMPFPKDFKKFRKENPLPKDPLNKKLVYLPTSRAAEGLVTVAVCGDSLRDISIADGDRLICQTQFEASELKNGKLVVAQLPCLGLVVKFYFKAMGKIILRSANPRYEDLIYDAELVEVKAIVLQSIKNWE